MKTQKADGFWCLGSESATGFGAAWRGARGIGAGLFLSILAACGGGGSSGIEPVPVACTITLAGDSTAHGTGASDIAFTPPGLLRAAFPGSTVIDGALGGSTSSDRINGTVIVGQGTSFAPWPSGVSGTYLANWGINDALRGISVSVYRANLEVMASYPGIVFVTPLPTSSVDTSAYVQVMREVAAENHRQLIDVNAYVLGLPNWQVLEADGTHPGDVLYRLIAANVLVPALSKECK